MRLSELQRKEIVNITSGKRLGYIIDVVVDTSGNIKSLILEDKKNRKLVSREEYELNWSQISKIGDDIILISDT